MVGIHSKILMTVTSNLWSIPSARNAAGRKRLAHDAQRDKTPAWIKKLVLSQFKASTRHLCLFDHVFHAWFSHCFETRQLVVSASKNTRAFVRCAMQGRFGMHNAEKCSQPVNSVCWGPDDEAGKFCFASAHGSYPPRTHIPTLPPCHYVRMAHMVLKDLN